MRNVPILSNAEVHFPANPPLPRMDEIPDDFKRMDNPHCRVASALFFNGGRTSDFGLTVKPEPDERHVHRAIRACLTSFEPQHEHKIFGVGFLLSEWFDGEPTFS